MSHWSYAGCCRRLDPDLQHAAEIERVVLTSRNLIVAALANAVNSLLVVGYLALSHDPVPLVAWLAVFQLLAAYIFVRWYRNRGRPRPEAPPRTFARKIFVSSVVAGGLWGMFGGYYFLVGSPSEQLLIGIVLAGISAGAAMALSSIPAAAGGYILAALLPLGVAATHLQGTVYLFLSGVTVIYIAFLFVAIRSGVLSFLHGVQLNLRNAQLLTVANDAIRAKASFVARFGHELRTPLNAVIGFSEVMKTQKLGPVGNPRYIEYVSWINESGHHLLKLINRIMEAERIESVHEEDKVAVVELKPVVQGVLQMVAATDQGRGVELVNRVPEACAVRVDPVALRQILINLVSNGAKFTDVGGSVAVDAAVGADGAVSIRVTDTGAGIPAEELGRITEPFVTGESVRHRNADGAGLGLAIAKMLAQMHRGDLTLESTVGVGTCARIWLPDAHVPGGMRPDAAVVA